MSHRNARLTVHGRLLLVKRVREEGWAVAHAAKAMGISRQCAHRWLKRFDEHGEDGLRERSSRPHRSPRATPSPVVDRILACRLEHRRGQVWIGAELGVARPHRLPGATPGGRGLPAHLDPMTGREAARSSKATATRYERTRPGELVQFDVKKLGKIPDGGGWRAHSMVDHHTRLVYSEIHED